MDIKQRSEQLAENVATAIGAIDIDALEQTRAQLQSQSSAKDFWNDQTNAQQVMKKLSDIDSEIQQWRELEKAAKEANELAKMNDESLQADLEKQLNTLEKTYLKLHNQLALGGPYDDYDALLSIHAGAGGTDAQDWAQMLLRMYTRWAESSDYELSVIDESAGEEAGIKSVSLQIIGRHAYGKLRAEHGVHRLVRLSPFNADAKRQTSFAKVEVVPKIDAPEQVPIDESDIKIDVFRAGGHGGQSVNTTDSAVRVTHIPTGIVVSIQNERSQIQNKETAMTILRSKLAALQLEQHAEKLSDLKGTNQSAEWGNQIRSYVLHPYTMVKDLRTRHETTDTSSVLDGQIDPFIEAFLSQQIKQ